MMQIVVFIGVILGLVLSKQKRKNDDDGFHHRHHSRISEKEKEKLSQSKSCCQQLNTSVEKGQEIADSIDSKDDSFDCNKLKQTGRDLCLMSESNFKHHDGGMVCKMQLR